MTSEQVRTDIENIKARVLKAESELKTVSDVDAGLTLQRERTDLQAYLNRLETRLVETSAAEERIRKEKEREAWETRRAELIASYKDGSSKIVNLVRNITPELVSHAELTYSLKDELRVMRQENETLVRQLYDGDVDRRTELTQYSADYDGDDACEIVEFALYLLENHKVGYGVSLSDVWRGLRFVG